MDDGQAGCLGWAMHAAMSVSSSAWRCRLCGFERYHRVCVMRRNGSRYETEFFACSQCSVMFLNPHQFNALGHAAPGVELPPSITPLRRTSKPGARRLR